MDYIQRLEEENTEQQEQMEVYLKFEKDYEIMKTKKRELEDELKEAKFQIFQKDQTIQDFKDQVRKKQDKEYTLQKRLELEMEGKDILRERADLDEEKEEKYKIREKELNQQIISQGENM